MERYDGMVSNKDSKDIRSQRSTRAETLPPDPSSTTPTTDHQNWTPGFHPSDQAPTPHRDDRGRASAHGPEPAVLTRQTRRQTASTVSNQQCLLGRNELMLQERPFGNSGAEHHPEPNHPQPIEKAAAAVPAPNHFWRMMTDPGFPSPASNPAPFVVTTEAFLGHTTQVQALAGMMQTIVPYLPQLMHSTAHQSALPVAAPQTESPVAPNQGAPPEVEPPQRQVVEARAASPTPTPARSQSRSYDPVQTGPNFDTLSSDTTDSLREQVRRVHQRLDEVQKEVLNQEGRLEKALKAILHSLPRYKPSPSRPPSDSRPSSLTMAAATR
ncbi:hypothetical protein BHE74_00043355 [Ensete ventricosum]|nr:hypothetical protein BHE74_00043355 [Ensete ventricosum]